MTKQVIFMGTPDFAVPILQALLDAPDFTVTGVVTRPDRRSGRGNKLNYSPVKAVALEHDIPLYQPEKLRGEDTVATLTQWPADYFVVAAYGQILRQNILDIPPGGCINVHASLLPRWRGAAPIQYAILSGDKTTGITTMYMEAGLDTGPMLKKIEIPITELETGRSLHDKLAAAGGPLLVKTLRELTTGKLEAESQDDSIATKAPRIQKEDGRINWEDPAQDIDRRVRAFTPWPGTFTHLDNQMLKILSGAPVLEHTTLAPGYISTAHPQFPLIIGTGQGSYAPARLQLEGRKALDVQDFLNGMPDLHGEQLT